MAVGETIPVADGAITKFYFRSPGIKTYDFWMGIDIDGLKESIGRSETLSDWVAPTPLRALAAALDHEDPAPEPGDAVRPCGQWLYCLPLHRESEIGPDGHGVLAMDATATLV